MKYKCTLLKELPDYSIGTTFDFFSNEINSVYSGDLFIGDLLCLVDKPNWIKKEVDYACLTEIKCEKCGNTKLYLHLVDGGSKYDCDVTTYFTDLYGECPCGNDNFIFKIPTRKKIDW